MNNYISTLKENKIRGQEIDIELYVPIGKVIYLDPSLEEIIYDIENVSNTWDDDMVGKKWVMLEDGLTTLEELAGMSFETSYDRQDTLPMHIQNGILYYLDRPSRRKSNDQTLLEET